MAAAYCFCYFAPQAALPVETPHCAPNLLGTDKESSYFIRQLYKVILNARSQSLAAL
jgi:hypothetical protein